MAKHKKGDGVRSSHHTPHMPAGEHGTVHSVHTNTTFYGVGYGGGVVYLPASSVDPDHDGDNDAPGSTTDTDHDVAALFDNVITELRRTRGM